MQQKSQAGTFVQSDVLTPKSYCQYLVKTAAALGNQGIDRSVLDSDRLFLDLLNRIHQEWRKAKSTGNSSKAKQLLRLIDKLGPTTGTGQFDMFKAYLRSLQPGLVNVPNPFYSEFNTTDPKDSDNYHSDEWDEFFEDSAKILVKYSMG